MPVYEAWLLGSGESELKKKLFSTLFELISELKFTLELACCGCMLYKLFVNVDGLL